MSTATLLPHPTVTLPHDADSDAVCEVSRSSRTGCEVALAVWAPTLLGELVNLAQTPRFKTAQAAGNTRSLEYLFGRCLVAHAPAHVEVGEARDIASTVDSLVEGIAGEIGAA